MGADCFAVMIDPALAVGIAQHGIKVVAPLGIVNSAQRLKPFNRDPEVRSVDREAACQRGKCCGSGSYTVEAGEVVGLDETGVCRNRQIDDQRGLPLAEA